MAKKSKQAKKQNQPVAKAAAAKSTVRMKNPAAARPAIHAAATTAAKTLHPSFVVNKVYVKDALIKSPGAPRVFKPGHKLASSVVMKISNHRLPEPGVYEVVVGATAVIKAAGGKIAAVLRVAQAGIFTLANTMGAQRQQILGKLCPDILLPYIRDKLLHMAISAGYPPIYLNKASFRAIPRRIVVRGKKNST